MANKYSNIAKGVGTKQTFVVVVWIVVIALFLKFSKVVFAFFNKITGSGPSEEDIKELNQQKLELQKLVTKYPSIWTKTSKPKSYFDSLANNIEQNFNRFSTDWSEQWNFIKNLTDTDMIGLYLAFGTRYNEEWSNMQGTLPMWIAKEDDQTYNPLSNGYIKLIKDKWYRVSGIIPDALRFKP